MWLRGARARKSPGDGEYVKPYVCSYLVACRMSLTQHVVVSVATRVDIVQIVSLQPARARSTVGVLYVYHTRPHEKRALLASAVVVARRTQADRLYLSRPLAARTIQRTAHKWPQSLLYSLGVRLAVRVRRERRLREWAQPSRCRLLTAASSSERSGRRAASCRPFLQGQASSIRCGR